MCVSAHILYFWFFTVSFIPKTAVLFPGHNVTFMCNVTNKFWLINDTLTRVTDNELADIDGITSTGPQLLTLVIARSANDTLYGCGMQMMGRFVADTGVVYVASTYIRRTYICIHMLIVLFCLFI